MIRTLYMVGRPRPYCTRFDWVRFTSCGAAPGRWEGAPTPDGPWTPLDDEEAVNDLLASMSQSTPEET